MKAPDGNPATSGIGHDRRERGGPHHAARAQGVDPGEVELALGVESARDRGPLRREQPVGADDLS